MTDEICKGFRGFTIRKAPPISKEALRRRLPPIGHRMRRRPTGKNDETTAPMWCEVVYVNYEHLFYRVRFVGGTHECYKVPEVRGC